MSAMMFILGADRSRYAEAIDQMQQDFLKGNSAYPKKINMAYTLLRNVKVKAKQPHTHDRDDEGHQFNVNGEESGDSGKDTRVCFRCGRPGHIAAKCNEEKHVNGHMLHTMGEFVEDSTPTVEEEVAADAPDDVEVSGNEADDFLFCSVDNQALMLYQTGFSTNSTCSRGGLPDT
eukprot:scaffold28580_cov308-Skeletonema_menzelii.AAC.1